MRILSFLFVALFSVSAFAGDTITEKDLEKFKTFTVTDSFKIKQNAITKNSLNSLAIRSERVQNMDRNFTHIVRRGKVTNQQRSGRCWIFAGFNVSRYYAEKKLKVNNFEFSENYMFFYHKLELANHLLNQVVYNNASLRSQRMAWLLRHGLTDGGYWDMFVELLDKYGAVPRDTMPETRHSSNTSQFNDLFNRLVKRHVAIIVDKRDLGLNLSQLESVKEHAMIQIYKFLALTLGTPPSTFEWRYQNGKGLTDYVTVTPKEFYEKYVKKTVTNKVHLMSDPALVYYQRYILNGLKNVSEMSEMPFLNVPPEVLENAAKNSIANNHPVWFGADVGKHSDIKEGILDTQYYDYTGLFGMIMEGNKLRRVRTYASTPTHAMVITGMDLDKEGKPVKWLVENSWGPVGVEQGYLLMTNDWMHQYVFDVVIEPQFVPTEARNALSGYVKSLPVWHHLWRKPIIR